MDPADDLEQEAAEQPAEFDYLLADPTGEQWEDGVAAGEQDLHFDPFDDETWTFSPEPVPWYRTPAALTVLVASSLAAAALVVAVVLLAFRGSPDERPTDRPAPATSAVATTSAAPPPSAEVPPPPPPPPPPESVSQVEQPPVVVRTEQRPTKKPEIGVTRTPATRAPISVRPQPRTGG